MPIAKNPVLLVTLPTQSKARNKRLEEGDSEKIQAAIGQTCAWYLRPLIELAIETGMRRGELLSLLWADVSLKKRIAHLPNTKNGHSRTIPLTSRAVAALRDLPQTDIRVFPVSGDAVRLAWNRLRKRAGLQDLRFHDLRHEAVSRFFEMGLSIPEVALISGHRDTRMLMRYTHLKPENIVLKLP